MQLSMVGAYFLFYLSTMVLVRNFFAIPDIQGILYGCSYMTGHSGYPGWLMSSKASSFN